MIKIVNMRCGYSEQPLCVARENICFSWSTQGANNQVAYRLQVAHDQYFKSIHIDTQKTNSSNNKYIYIHTKLSKKTRYYWRVKVFCENKQDTWSSVQLFETAHGKFDAKWITSEKKRDHMSPAPATRFRKEFIVNKEIKYARLYTSAQGLYVSYINGDKCGSDYLTPGWTEYQTRIQYQIHDVKDQIIKGANCLSATVTDGWYMGPIAPWDNTNGRCRFGETRALFAQLEIFYQDGTEQIIITDQSWYSDLQSPYTRCEIYYGVDYDSRLEDDFHFVGSLIKSASQDIPFTSSLIPSYCISTKKVQEINPIKIIRTKEDELVVDMGQNMVGTIELNLIGKLGQEIELVFFETLDQNKCVYTENLRSARQGLKYIAKEGENHFIPEMTFFGFRYIHIIKWPNDISLDNIKGIVLSSNNRRTGYFKANNDLVNQLVKNTRWGQIGNYLDIPTDCPQRDERLGWTGDAQIFFKTAAYNYDVQSFFVKWLDDMSYAQFKDGGIPHVVPDVLRDNNSSSGWGESCIIIPWQLYERYGDIDILKRYYPMMEKFIDFCETQCETKHIRSKGFHFGDWLALDGGLNRGWGQTPKDLIATLYYGYCAKLMYKISTILNLSKQSLKFKNLYKNIMVAFKKEFITSSGRLSGHTQTAYSLALAFDMLEKNDRLRAIKELVNIINDFGFITCGFLGSSYVLDVLTENDHHDLALKMALKSSYPSWLYPITMGATTIWEHWNSLLPDGSVNPDTMNSFNHYAYGAVVNWYYEKIAGIIPDEENPGYKHFYLYPRPCNELSKVDAKLDTHYGTISISYCLNIDNDHVDMQINVPDNTSCNLILEACKAYQINEKRKKNNSRILLSPGAYDISYVRGGSMMAILSMEKNR
ncbi:MAG: family 78 glycoside hydrolase catalytic domain [Clostridiales bacterium]|nr:family 78 glycoside hydrolase catalytic domain [Clostridiales bacterium]